MCAYLCVYVHTLTDAEDAVSVKLPDRLITFALLRLPALLLIGLGFILSYYAVLCRERLDQHRLLGIAAARQEHEQSHSIGSAHRCNG